MAKEVMKGTIAGMLDRMIAPPVLIGVMNTAVGVLAVRILVMVYPPLAPLLSSGPHNSTGSDDELSGWRRGRSQPEGRLQHLPRSRTTQRR